MMLQSVGWKSAPNTDSLEHWTNPHKTTKKMLLTPLVYEQDVMSPIVCLTHLDLSQSVLSLPVPDGKDVVVGVVYRTQRVSSILTYRKIHNAMSVCCQNSIKETDSQKHDRNSFKTLCFLTDLEKARQTRARSKKPEPRTWSVLRLTESHTRTWGASFQEDKHTTPAWCDVRMNVIERVNVF